MKKHKVLDDIMILNKSNIHWWEKKRLRYNLILLLTEFLVIVVYWRFFQIFFTAEEILYYTFLFNLCANFFFTFGWITELLVIYYFNKDFKKNYRLALFWIGIIFTIAFTVNEYCFAIRHSTWSILF